MDANKIIISQILYLVFVFLGFIAGHFAYIDWPHFAHGWFRQL